MAFFIMLQEVMKVAQDQTTAGEIATEAGFQFARFKGILDVSLWGTVVEVINTASNLQVRTNRHNQEIGQGYILLEINVLVRNRDGAHTANGVVFNGNRHAEQTE